MAEKKPSTQKPSERLMAILDDAFTRTEVLEFLQKVTQTIKKVEKTTADDVRNLAATVTAMQEKLSSDTSVTLEEMKEYVRAKVDSLKDGKDGAPGEPGIDADEEYIIGQVLSRIVMPEVREPIMDTGVEIANKLENLPENEKLDPEKALRGWSALVAKVTEVASRPVRSIGGAKGFTLMVNGVKKLLTAQTLNIVPGSGVSISYSHANGRNDVTISAAGGNVAVLTATGNIDGSNATYTFASEPVLVIVNGASYRDGAGVAITGTSAVLDFAPQTGSDVYGLG